MMDKETARLLIDSHNANREMIIEIIKRYV